MLLSLLAPAEILAQDYRPSKVRGALLPEENDLLRVLQNTSFIMPSWTNEVPACDWRRVSCDDKRRVSRISWYELHLIGELHWSFFPMHLKSIDLSSNLLHGQVPFDVLPVELETLNLSGNKFYGKLDFTCLPPTLRALLLRQNEFDGAVALPTMPKSLQKLSLSMNKFTGTLDFSNLPPNLTMLSLDANAFTGSVSFPNLPKTLRWLNLTGNCLSGTVDLRSYLGRQITIKLSYNAFDEILPSDLPVNFYVRGQQMHI